MTHPSPVDSFDNLSFVEELYAAWRANPQSVPDDWRTYFAQLGSTPAPRAHAAVALDVQELRLSELVDAYRTFGHRAASLDPLSGTPATHPALAIESYGFTQADLSRTFAVAGLFGLEHATLGEVVEKLRRTYCRTIGVELRHIEVPEIQKWLTERMEATENRLALSREQQLRLLQQLTEAETFEQFIHAKFLGAKRFSLEGSETLIPLVDLVIEASAERGVEEIVIGMAHRGRLNVLANVIGKPPSAIFREFQDLDWERLQGGGDVKYHLGFSTDRTTPSGKRVHLSLSFNPSHLEAIDPVVIGRVRAKQDRLAGGDRLKGLGLLIHGDAAFAGQGIVAECLNFSEIPGYRTGGTIHLIVNNQVGFTTPPEQGRSTLYATSVARMLDIPVFHVNGEDPEAVAQVVSLAVEFRHRFQRDVVIDMYCFRKYGHNEGDEPRFTQPVMYARIDARPSVRDAYVGRLVAAGQVTADEAKAIAQKCREKLDAELQKSRTLNDRVVSPLSELWSRYQGGLDADAPEATTAVPLAELQAVGHRTLALPAEFEANPKLVRGVLLHRAEMLEGKRPVDYAFAENLAFATLLEKGTRVRLSGQDVARGTFTSRHAEFYDMRDGRPWAPLQHLSPTQGAFEVRNSPLSEYGVMGFEYGYSLDYPDALVLWEAQFGDFVNGAQIILDQFLSSAEDKWQRLSGLVLLLPHGFEGQGPEHSSARLERFLTMSAEDNWTVVNLTTSAQYFHVLRRQALRQIRKPLVVMSPKWGLRNYTSDIGELATGSFQKVLGDTTVQPERVRKVLLCSGKVYYALEQARRERGIEDTAIVRLEQLYPYPQAELTAELRKYPNAERLVWVQEEPWNMGAWFYLRAREYAGRQANELPLECVARKESASPATGSPKAHELEQKTLIDQAFQDADTQRLRALR